MNSRIPGEAERHDETEWLPVTKLNCGALLYEPNQGARARARFRLCKADMIIVEPIFRMRYHPG
ncbi:hypothetical protein GQ600_19261 [Phytophthora cactorum]|nr:hypothetical protein GQ600_12671 [Phytophthora cactorum]KAF1787909.1 hypothetical protein GQ600_19261 [Phytophthora cactorum]